MIAFAGVAIRQGSFALAGLDFAIPRGAYAVLMGRTGSGKTTIAELICGLRRPSAGSIAIGGVDVTRLPPGARGIGYVPQDGVMFPGWTVGDQLAFALRIRGHGRRSQLLRAEELAAELGIGHLLGRSPDGLSGGERQRVALGRALAHRPEVLVLDEPLASLDAQTQAEMTALLRRTHAAYGFTAVHITHAAAEAASLGTLRLHLVEGRLSVGGEEAVRP